MSRRPPGFPACAPRWTQWALAVALLVLGFTAAAGTREPLVSAAAGTLTALEASVDAEHLVALDGRLLAIGAQGASLLVPPATRWERVEWTPDRPVVGVAAGSDAAFVLLGTPAADGADAIVETVARLQFVGARPVLRELPRPQPSTGARGAWDGGVLYLAGRDASGALHLQVLRPDAVGARWETHEGPADARGLPTSAAAQNGSAYLTLPEPGGGERLLQWSGPGGWRDRGPIGGAVVAAAARPIGQAHALYLVRTDAGLVEFRSYHTISGAWATLAPTDVSNLEHAVAWGDGFAWTAATASGDLSTLELRAPELLLRPLDWAVIAVYLVGMSAIGFWFYAREKRQSTADFFVGARSIPFWAAGISLYATNTSSISYIAIPAKAFETNWTYLTNNLVAVLGLVFVAIWIVPLLRRLDLMSVFHYLEIRFHPAIRMLASALCILVQIGSRLSVVMFLPALAISAVTGIDVVWSILAMGAVTIVYTALGGMKAVIWTDFAQLFVMFGGALFAIGLIVWQLDGGVGELVAVAAAEDKTKLLDWDFNLVEATVWGFIFLVVFDVVLTFPKDQVLMQRVLATKSAADAGRSVWTFAAIMIPGGFLFYMIGTALYAFYQANPERMNPMLANDATFPLFIAAEMPAGVTGLIVAGILAASMSTLSSIMNSVATLVSVDFYEKLVPRATPERSVRFAEWTTVVVGLIGMGAAWLLSTYDIHSMFDVSIELAGLLGGGFAGAYTLGMFTRRANWQGVSIGIASAIAITTFAWTMDLVHPYFYLAISIMSCIVVGYVASYAFPPPAQTLVGLTILTPAARDGAEGEAAARAPTAAAVDGPAARAD